MCAANSSSASAPSGDTSVSAISAMPEKKQACRHDWTGLSRSARRRART